MADIDYRRFEALAAELDAEEAAEAAAAAAAKEKGEEEGAPEYTDTSPAGLAAARAKAAGGLKKTGGDPGKLNDADLHPYFWDTIPENADDHEAKMAMDALLEEDSPEERALNYKVQGNKKLEVARAAQGSKLQYREAAAFYTKGLAERCGDDRLNALLYSNRAQVQLTLGNNAKALEDALEAIKLDETSIKSYFRGARAALRTERWPECEQLCTSGLKLDPSATELTKIQQAAVTRRVALAEVEERRRGAQREAKTTAVSLAMAVTGRGWQLGRPQFSVGSASKPTIDAEGMFHWPVVVMYPEVMASDSIEDFHEAVTVGAHLDQMFGPDAPPLDWDEAGHYSRSRVELYYLAHAGKPLTEDQMVEVFMGQPPSDFVENGPQRFGTKQAVWVRADEGDALGEVLQRPDHVIPGVPVFFAVAADTEFRTRFLANDIKSLGA